MTLRTAAAVMCILCLVGAPALADATSDAIKKAQVLYRQGKLGKSYTQLEEAAAAILQRMATQYARTYAAAPAGWTLPPYTPSSKKIKRQLGRGILLIRHYRQNTGSGVATAQMIIDNRGVVAGLIDVLSNPATVKRMKGTWVPIAGGGKAIVTYNASRKRGDIRLLVARRFYITITARNIESRAFLTNLLSSWDFAGLRKTGGVN
ncbi:MAG: hypothetical protein OEQ29_15495 [Alphaproteobacteria bacterium]|nr:hypothetical protein [Alphaproteobacteria bacterium]